MGHRLDKYGLGTKRPIEDFYKITGLNMDRQTVERPRWCVEGTRHELADKNIKADHP
jgi:hypothetical protein